MPKAKYRLHATRVDRIAVVDRPAVPDAEIVVFKRFGKDDTGTDVLEKGATAYQNLPLAEEGTAWSGSAARKRVLAWAGGPDKEKVDWNKYRKAFMWYDSENADQIGSYKLPYADIIGGTLKAVPRAIFAIVASVAGGRGGVNIPREDKVKVLNHCKKYYKKMDKEFPEVSIKAYEKMLVEGFTATFILKATQAAVDTLQEAVWYAIYDESGKTTKMINDAFADFVSILKNVIAKVVTQMKVNDDAPKLTKEDVVKPFARGLGLTAISESFAYFRANMTYLMMSYDQVENPDEIIDAITKHFEQFVVKNSTEIVRNKSEEAEEEFEKAGRIISSARLRKLREAISVLSEIVGEAETRYSKSEEDGMELKELIEKFDTLSAQVELVVKELKNAGFLKTEAEKQEALEAEKKAQEEAEAQKVEAEKKAEEARVEAEKKAEAEKVEAEKKAAEEAEAEKKRQEEKVEAEKKAEERLVKIEKTLGEVGKFIEVVGKRFGVKTSLDTDAGGDGADKEDVFGKALRG